MSRNKYRSEEDTFHIRGDLRVLVKVIGYGGYGESTLVLLMDGIEPIYKMVIDSYQYRKKPKNYPYVNKTIDLLNGYNDKRLDLLCWTHPHEDHTKGLGRLVTDFCDANTKVVYPIYVDNDGGRMLKLKDADNNAVNTILRKNNEKETMATPIGVPDKGVIEIDCFTVMDIYESKSPIDVSIKAISPISHILAEHIEKDVLNDSNDLSVVILLDVGGYCFYFGGDTTNDHIDCSNRRLMRKCQFVKIPHHGSDTAVHLIGYLPPALDAACTTVYNRKALRPMKEIIDAYKEKKAEVYSTNTNPDAGNHPYGIIEYDYQFNLSTAKNTMKVKTEGSAGRL